MNRNERAGRLDRRITIQRAVVTPDAFGTPVVTWQDIACLWANLSYPATGSGETQYDAVHLATTNVVWTIRNGLAVLQTDRILYDAQAYDITRISESTGPGGAAKQSAGRNAYLAITAELRK